MTNLCFLISSQLTEALAFLHNSCRYIHRNVNPGAVYITKSGKWKLAGMEFIGECAREGGIEIVTCQRKRSLSRSIEQRFKNIVVYFQPPR